jgi:SAM-dependent methyltransferase
MIAAHDADPGAAVLRSFRDPAGVLIRYRERILRAVHPDGVADLEAFLATAAAREALEAGKLVRSARITPSEIPELAPESEYLLEHERVPFPSYPSEWPPEMLHAAGALTIELAQRALDEGFGLKDATPYNVLFRGSRPVFIDVLSFERRQPLDPAWMAYAQFVRTFLLPLLVNRAFGLPLACILSSHRDGLEPETVYGWAGFWRRLTPRFLGLVSMPKWLGASKSSDASLYRPKSAASAGQARYILNGVLRSCARHLSALEPGAVPGESTWSGYLDHKSLYTPAQLAQKEAFVSEALALARPRTVLDVGANEGHFSFLAANTGASVIAIDSDPVVTGSIWRRASRAQADVLPLVVDLARPTPATGWRNVECASFLDRARGHFDMVLMLAVVHHMLVTERIPLDDLLTLAGELARDYVLIEFVASEDPMFQKLVRGRQGLYSHLTNVVFEAAAAPRFELVRSARIHGLHRWLYLFRRRGATNSRTY